MSVELYQRVELEEEHYFNTSGVAEKWQLYSVPVYHQGVKPPRLHTTLVVKVMLEYGLATGENVEFVANRRGVFHRVFLERHIDDAFDMFFSNVPRDQEAVFEPKTGSNSSYVILDRLTPDEFAEKRRQEHKPKHVFEKPMRDY